MKISKHHVHKFESVPEFVAACTKRAKSSAASHNRSSGFTGTKSFDEAVKLASDGWSDVRPQVDAILEPLREKLAEVLDVTVERWHDIIGSDPDIDRFVAGEFECMWDDIHIPTPTNGKVFTLLLSNAVNCNVSTETILKRGAALAAMVEAFTIMGCELEIWVETSSRDFGGGWYGDDGREREVFSTLVCVHKAGDNLDVNNVMFPLGHPSWLRRLWFGFAEGATQAQIEHFGFIHGGYGQAFDEPTLDREVGASIVLAMGANQNWAQGEDTVAWILNQLKMQGVWQDPNEG